MKLTFDIYSDLTNKHYKGVLENKINENTYIYYSTMEQFVEIFRIDRNIDNKKVRAEFLSLKINNQCKINLDEDDIINIINTDLTYEKTTTSYNIKLLFIRVKNVDTEYIKLNFIEYVPIKETINENDIKVEIKQIHLYEKEDEHIKKLIPRSPLYPKRFLG